MSTLGLSSAPDPLRTVTAAAQQEIVTTLHKGANWLFIIAGLSVINTISTASGGNWTFLGGLGITQLAAAVAMRLGTGAQIVALLINLWAAAFFVCLGIFARKGQRWTFITGMALYAADGLIVVLIQAWIMFLFHGFVLFRLYQGYSSSKELHAFDKPTATGTMPYPS